MNYSEFAKKYSLSLSAQQRRAVESVDGHILLLAVPGSGKTTVLVARLGYMILCCGISPSRILTMTYTVSATRDMRERFSSLFGAELASQLEFRTINGVSAKIIQRYERLSGGKAFELESDEKVIAAMLSDIYRRIKNDYLPDGEVKQLMSKIGYAKNMMLDEAGIAAIDKEIPDFSKIYAEYNARMRSQKRMDYDDQMVYAYRILLKYPEILQTYREEIKYFCVDEAQDTSMLQHQIIDLLSSESGNLFMVGDEDQSIYGFRAAYPEALTRFDAKYPDAKILLMEKNYRSSRNIVAAADKVIRKNKSRREKKMTTSRDSGSEVAEIRVSLRKEQYPLLEKIGAGASVRTAVLFRDNSSALPLIDLLERDHISYYVRQNDLSFFTNRTVRDISDIIRFSYDRSNRELFLNIYYKLNAYISKDAANYAVSHNRSGRSLLDFIAANYSVPQRVRKKCEELEHQMNLLQRDNGGTAVYRILAYMGYSDWLEKRGSGDNEAQIMRYIGEHEPSALRLLERMDELRTVCASGETSRGSNFILSTIHSSKGLEYDCVYLIDVADGILPCCDRDDIRSYEEERRLFYVGMTRAKNELNIFTYKEPSYPSEFTDILFGSHAEKAGRKLPLTLPGHAKSILNADEFKVNGKVLHRHFGKGVITARENTRITVRFESGRTLNLELSAIQNPDMIKVI